MNTSDELTVRGEPFSIWYRRVEPRLRRALVAALGAERGRDATAGALAWAWEHLDKVQDIENPTAYLYRTGRSQARRRRVPIVWARPEWNEPWIEPRLGAALRSLTERQRVAVVLVHGYCWTLAEVADLQGIRVTTVQTHLDRGLYKLRAALEVAP